MRPDSHSSNFDRLNHLSQCCSETYHRQKTYHRQTNIFKFTRYFYKLAQINLSSARIFPEDFNTHDTFHRYLSTMDILDILQLLCLNLDIVKIVHTTSFDLNLIMTFGYFITGCLCLLLVHHILILTAFIV